MKKYKYKPLPTQEYLRECFSYNEESGELVWKERPLGHFKNKTACNIVNSKLKSKVVSTKCHGHLTVNLDKERYFAHRIIWKMMTLSEPLEEIDHINNVRDDNRWCNLREASPSNNQHNRPLQNNNNTGYKGISLEKRTGKFYARLRFNWKNYYLGTFDTIEIANEALINKRESLHKEFTNHG